ncbi:MAG: bacterial Ig-like domain-containing protein [Clostridiales bacterium]|nr:bacterial Ig-like domain-containing protein [Clostridiales bacterium]
MSKKIRSILIVLLSVVAIVFTAFGIAACNNVKLDKLRIENARTEFKVGDEFEVGEDFTVYAIYSDGSEKDVTQEVELRYEAGFDMNVAGNYQITVSWGGKREIYTIYVNEFDNILKKIELNDASVKKVYNLGESVDLTGLEVICTYENAQGNPVVKKTTSLKDFIVKIEGDDGHVVTDVFDKLGNFTVTISIGAIKDSFEVSVSGVNISTVQGAIAVGKAFSGEIVSGSHIIKDTQPYAENNKEHISYAYTYEFGINFTYITETVETNDEFYYSMNGSKIFCVRRSNGEIVPTDITNADMMYGSPYSLWYHRENYYGAENVLAALYRAAKECSNKDLKESANEANREYSFSFSGLVLISNASDYYETSVTFTLGDDYAIKHIEYKQEYWEYSVLRQTFVTNAAGYTTPIGKANEIEVVTVDQVSGERTKENPYSADKMLIQSYDLVYDGQTLGDNGVIEYTLGQVENNLLTVRIENMQPTTSNFSLDPMYFNYPGNFDGEVDSATMLYTDGFFAFRNENKITIQPLNGGVWKLILRTSGTYKTITLNITGLAPTSITSQLYNSATGRFYEGNAKTVAVGGAIYFKGAVNQYANEAQTARVTSSNSEYATIVEETLNGVKCFKFSATKAGTYSIRVTSAVASDIYCTYTFTVDDVPDYSAILSGSYTVTDWDGNIYTLQFTPAGGDGNSGTVVITKTPTTEAGEPIPDQAKTQTLSYRLDIDTLEIVLTSISGENLGADLIVNEQGQLVLDDQYGHKYTLNRVN